jgi:hypothetical protein
VPRYLEIDINDVTDRNGIVHCWGCGAFVPNGRRHGDHPTYLCRPCYDDHLREIERQRKRDKRLKDAIARGRLVGPPIQTDYLDALRSDPSAGRRTRRWSGKR